MTGDLKADNTPTVGAFEPPTGNGLCAPGVPVNDRQVKSGGELLPVGEARHEGGVVGRILPAQDEVFVGRGAGGSEAITVAAERAPVGAKVAIVWTVAVCGEENTVAQTGGGR